MKEKRKMILALLNEAFDNIEKVEAYSKEKHEVYGNCKSGAWEAFWKKWPVTPRKKYSADRILIVRQMLLEVSKELEKLSV